MIFGATSVGVEDVVGAEDVIGAGDVAGAEDVGIHLTCPMIGDGSLKGVLCFQYTSGGGLTPPFLGGLIGGGLVAWGPHGISLYVVGGYETAILLGWLVPLAIAS